MKAHVAANSLLQKSFLTRQPLTHLKLQKLLYFLHGWHLAITGIPVVDEGFQAWDYGPVIPELYQQLRQYGAHAIDDYIRDIDPMTGQAVAYVANAQDHQFWAILDKVWEQYAGYSALQLSTLSHEPNSAWHIARQANAFNAPIDNGTIQACFQPAITQRLQV